MEFDKKLYEELKQNVCDAYGVRYDEDKDKKEFRKYIEKIASKYCVSYDETNYSDEQNKNIIIGDINNAKVILCAHYDTAHIYHYKALHEGIKSLSKLESTKLEKVKKSLINIKHPRATLNNYNDNSFGVILALMFLANKNVSIVLFDNEEKGRLGSSFFASKYLTRNNEQVFINFDCIGYGLFLILDYNIHNQEVKKIIKESFEGLRYIPSIFFSSIPTDATKLKKI